MNDPYSIRLPDDTEKPAAQDTPDLPPEFWIKLLSPPACRIGLPCDGCGRCEH